MKVSRQRDEKIPRLSFPWGRVFGLLVVALFWMAWTACSPAIQLPPDGGQVGIGLCRSNDECLDGYICVNRYCKYPGNLPGNQIVSLHILPPATHRYRADDTVVVKQQFSGIDASKLNEKSIILRSAYLISGRVEVLGSKKPIPARIGFFDRESIDSAPIEITAESGDDGRFKARLTHGKYDVEIIPTNGKHPPMRVENVNIEQDGALKLELPKDADYPRLAGRIVTPDTATPIAGLRIQVFSASDKSISSTAVTDEKGAFSLWLSHKEKPHRIRIHMRPYAANENSGHPQIDIPFSPATMKGGETIDLGELKVGYLSKASDMPVVSGAVHATEQHGGQPLKSCEVHLIGTIDLKATYKDQPIVGYYRVTTNTEEGGAFRVKILPGAYQVDVLPSLESREKWARASVELKNISSDMSDFQIHLRPKPTITGRICQKGEKGQCIKDISEAQVQAVWRGPLQKPIDIDKRPSVPVPETPTQLSKSEGWYTLPLDPGIYDLIFVPPADSGLARRIRFNVRVEASDTPQNVDAYLSSANHLSGLILGPDHLVIPNTVIEMYSHPSDPNEPVRLLGRATTNAEGKFSLAYHIPSKD